jgi:surface antigen
MSAISDEMLMAYADDELIGLDRAQVEMYLAQSSDGAARLAAFTTTGKRLAGLYDQPMREPVPQHLIDAVRGVAQTAGAQHRNFGSNIVALGPKRPKWPEFSASRWPMAAAASVAVLIAGTATLAVLKSPASDQQFATVQTDIGHWMAVAGLAAVLEATPTGVQSVMQNSGTAATIKPIFTFPAVRNEFCRQYEIERAGANAIGGVACRESPGQWRVETQVVVAPTRSSEKQIVAAGRESPVDAVVDHLIKGDVLSVEAEAALLRSGWVVVSP